MTLTVPGIGNVIIPITAQGEITNIEVTNVLYIPDLTIISDQLFKERS